MMGAAILTNLPALLVVVPLLLAPFSAVLPIAGLAWVLALVGTGISFLAALMLQSVTENGVRISYHLGNWEPPWGIEFVVDSASSLTLVVMSGPWVSGNACRTASCCH
jgi:multicomponent Na+:H+ antiporter subunit D